MKQIIIIVATDKSRGIGIRNTLPWRLPEDLAHFKKMTNGYPIIMGRKTFDSIGRPLPNRHNIVITRNPAWQYDGVDAVATLEAALGLVASEQVFIIGGTQIYTQALPHATRLIVTEIDKQFECDAFFPAIDSEEWEIIARDPQHSDSNDFDYAYVTYQRIKSVK